MELICIAVAVVACGGVLALVLAKPSVTVHGNSYPIFWVPVAAGALVLLCSGAMDPVVCWQELTRPSAVNPLKILVLFFSMTFLSVYLDETGFFRMLAAWVLRVAGKTQIRIFTVLYFAVAVLTVVTSNDIIILTFSPFLCYFAKHANINPVPYLFAEFVSANTWSMMLIIGNPTNVYLATSAGIDFSSYFLVMALPAIAAGVTAFFVLYLCFRKQLAQPISAAEQEPYVLREKTEMILGLVHLGGCTVLLAVSSYLNLEMWLVSLVFALSLAVCVTAERCIKKENLSVLGHCLKRAPWELVPFVLSMFVIVLALEQNGVTDRFFFLFSSNRPILSYGVGSFLSANLINNIPMSVLFGSLAARSTNVLQAVYASVIGSNVGAFFTPIGALAGIMWTGILKNNGVQFGFRDFIRHGLVVAVPTLTVALGVLALLV